VLKEVGLVQNVVANRTTGHLVDGHLRVMLAMREKQPTVPVTWVELSEEEEHLILASLDPLAAMATADAGALDALLSSVQSGEEGVQAMLADLAAHSGLYDAGETPHLDDLADEYGDPRERDFWPFIRVQVSPDTFRRWRSLMDGLPGEDEANKAAQILEAVDVTVFGSV
jgi:hypothetical protein